MIIADMTPHAWFLQLVYLESFTGGIFKNIFWDHYGALLCDILVVFSRVLFDYLWVILKINTNAENFFQ